MVCRKIKICILHVAQIELRPDLITPSVFVALEGNSVSFTCISDEEPNWKRYGLLFAMPAYVDVYNINETLHTITIPNLISEHTGEYICDGIFHGTKFTAEADLYVGSKFKNLLDPKNICLLLMKDQRTLEGFLLKLVKILK